MSKYNVILNGFKIGIVLADSEDKALLQAIYLYGMEVDVELK